MGGVAWNTGYPDPSPRRGKGPIISPPQGPAEHNTLSVLLVSVFLFKEKKQKFPSFFIGGAFPPPNPPSHYYWGQSPQTPFILAPSGGQGYRGPLRGPLYYYGPCGANITPRRGLHPRLIDFSLKREKSLFLKIPEK